MVDGGLWHGGVTLTRERRGNDVMQGEGPYRRRLDGEGVDGVDAERRTDEPQGRPRR
jgi:hypothetical protein